MAIHGALQTINYRIRLILSKDSAGYAFSLGKMKIRIEGAGLQLWFSVYGNAFSKIAARKPEYTHR
jgi:hypothetical protein